jgi:hypothetical protein
MRYILLLAVLALLSSHAPAPAKNFTGEKPPFLPDYADAKIFFSANRSAFAEICDRYDLPEEELLAVVAPENYRYARFRDWLETAGLELAYVHGGRNVVDFSIGPFQMKPSFVEDLESAIARDPDLARTFPELLSQAGASQKTARQERLLRLEDTETQLRYVCAFWMHLSARYPELARLSAESRIAFVGTAYNLGIHAPVEEIRSWQSIRAFPYGRKSRAPQCSYAEAAVAFYREAPFNGTH